MTMIVKTAVIRILLLIIFYESKYATSLIIPEELPTILSLIYSNIPPIKKGTDSRFGIGFRLGEHADFQILIELGPQTETDQIGTSNDAKKRRDVMYDAAIRGELGSFAQQVAKYQMKQRLEKEKDKVKTEDKFEKIQTENKQDDKDTASNNWLMKWRKEMSQSSENNTSLNSDQNKDAKIQQRIEKPIKSDIQTDKLEELTKLYKSQNIDNKEILS
ncbi:uncharacterized protein LOC105249544 isoform X1 [Camponotus floridanus]|uniref:uncharacterized protein LOC105249544 isoform X1 n=1 Tax=Camponotus floridanus TaxID=104421 RepID=UPI0009716126|nr:uncharacterized protein LOC105249544 isoform X1 [Camponotus floridanus]XP_019882577.1 uncharacterized protein LOC105249544 isoform X1 [Camponotus floridanus]XP_025266644.1 uncharacterized protein LOC105249544 isoform X1 [Camponotus floridanus]XP_025266645.1 uncharacterized protein LOC105249544 isoform X1 [Camponotus floridanus]